MKFPRSYMSNCMGARFFRWGLPPHTLIINRLPSKLNTKDAVGACPPGSLSPSGTLQEKAPKSGRAET